MIRRIVFSACMAAGGLVFADSWRCYQPDRVFIGPEYQYARWHDFGSSNANNEVGQSLWGGVGGYEHIAPKDIYARVWSRLQSGPTDSETSGEDWYDHNWQLEADIGYTWAFGRCCNWFLSPFVGVGYFQNRSNQTSPYHEYEVYIPIGALLTWDLSRAWSIGLRGEANIQVYRRFIHTATTNLTGASDKTNWVAELPITYRFCSRPWDLSLVPEFAWNPTTTTEAGVKWGSEVIWGLRLELGYRW